MSEQPTNSTTPPPPKTSSGSGDAPQSNPFTDEPITKPNTDTIPHSSSPEPIPAAAPAATTPPAVGERTGPIDPRVSALLAMFPDFDESVMASVLQSVNWNQDRAVEILLGMSDPEYKPPAEEQRAPLTQEELDEQFARQLVLQDQEAHARAVAQYEQQQGQRPDDPRYQQHRRASQNRGPPPSQGQNQGQQGQGEPDPMAEIGQQLKEGLEVGKKTLNSWFNRAKQKYSEFEQQRQQQAAASASTPPQQPWGQNPADQSYAYYQPPGGISTSASGQPHSAGITSAGSQHSSFYDPNPASPISPIEPQQQQPTGRPSIDGGKFGVLPKRPVSLIADDHSPITLSDNTSSTKVQTTSPTTTTTPAAATSTKDTAHHPVSRKSTDDDELEYAENPFEDEGRR